MTALDNRLVTIGIEVNGQLLQYTQPLKITAQGMKFANANQNEATVTLSNISPEIQDYILTETSPFNANRTPKVLTISAGRVSYGVSQIYIGNIVSAKVSQPPDVTLTLRCLTGDYDKGDVVSKSKTSKVSLSALAADIAKDLGLTLNFQANDKKIANYSFTGSNLRQVDVLGTLGFIDAFVDDKVLFVKESSLPLSEITKIISLDTGMIGIPDITEQGLTVTFLLDNSTRVGALLHVTSERYPAANGDYIIYQLGFDITTRDVPFYYTAKAKRLING